MITLHPSSISGEVWIPSSKSQTIRALLIAFFSHGRSIIRNPLISADTQSCISVLETLGASIECRNNSLHVDSSSITLTENDEINLDCGNSGTTAYLLYGLLGTLPFRKIILTGDGQLRRRPVKPLADAYNDLGMTASCTAEGTNAAQASIFHPCCFPFLWQMKTAWSMFPCFTRSHTSR